MALHARVPRDRLLVVASMAKAFGVPCALAGGPAHAVERLFENGLTARHCSPVSRADAEAVLLALRRTELEGEFLRARLLANIRAFRATGNSHGHVLSGGTMPLQRLRPGPGGNSLRMARLLEGQGIQALPLKSYRESGELGFLIRADHTRGDILRTWEALERLGVTAKCNRETGWRLARAYR
jgi:8-amino-7-oxononanoate synthase